MSMYVQKSIRVIYVANVGLVYILYIYRVGIIDYAINIMLLVECHERTYCHGNPWGDV